MTDTPSPTVVTPAAASGGAPVATGEILGGKYRVDRVLGEGGMGVVVAATHLQLEERVALKFLLLDAGLDEAAGHRFLREARAAVKIKSEHVARVRDVGTLEGGRPFIVMEYLEGRDLAQLLAQEGPLLPAVAVAHVLQSCEAIAEAHRAGVVHRDLKPSNLFLTRRGDGSPCVKVLDFGISKLVTDPDSSGLALTQARTPMGTPAYMSPEQMRSAKDVDARTDVWSLGAVLAELLTGLPPFPAESMADLCAMILTSPAPVCSERNPRVPPALDAVVARCLEKSPASRYQTVGELAEALRAAIPRRDLTTTEVSAPAQARPTPRPQPSPGAAREAGTQPDAETPPAATQRARPLHALARAAMGVVAIGLAGIVLVRVLGAEPPPREERSGPSAAPSVVDAVVPTNPEPPVEAPAPTVVDVASPPPSASSPKASDDAAKKRPVRTRTAAAAPTRPVDPSDFGGRQ